eukprot:TRINITY_DN3364_c0_g1_i2.p1 TRINITY_DN3364_c0_g1~~TRINITY_DN3364_c0_g1_i2.p1  ORF type:complete len:204 (+),score=73.96 TRINITY_DN3364_c0_g1_i2:632-1243(+)
MVVIPPGPHNFVDMIVTTIMTDEQGNAPPAPGGFGVDGIDPGLDPELAEAIRMSLEAERERTERERQQKMEVDQEGAHAAAAAQPATQTPSAGAPSAVAGAEGEEDMDEETAMALAMSMEQFDHDGDAVMKDEPATGPATAAPSEQKSAETAKALQDPSFVDDLLNDLNIPKDQIDIDDILSGLNDDKKKDQPKKDDKNDKPQ